MTLEEAGKKFDFPIDKLQRYVSFGFIKNNSPDGYEEEDFNRLGLIETLLGAGFTVEEAGRYLSLTENTGSDAEQIRMLKKQRRLLLDDIHKKQQFLDNLDYMIWKKNRR